MNEYTQGICMDGAAILKNGEMMTIEEILHELRQLYYLKALLPKIKADAVRDAIDECNCNGADGQGWQSDLEQYANKLEAGE